MPMTDTEFRAYADRLSLSPQARAYVDNARNSPPARRVESRVMRNTTWRYASKKMGVTISGESTLEKNYHVLLDFDPEVLEFWEQPPTIPLLITDRNGRIRRVPHTFDVLVLAKHGVHLDQVKSLDHCQKLSTTQPNRWMLADSVYQDVAANGYLESLGLAHRVITDATINSVKANNLLAIARASAMPRSSGYGRLSLRLFEALREYGAITASSAVALTGVDDSTSVLQLLADEQIVANLEDADLGNLDKIWLATDVSILQAVQASVQLQVENGDGNRITTGRDAAALLERIRELQGSTLRSKRTLRRWRMAVRAGNGDVINLVPRIRHRGNRLRRIEPVEIELVEKVIKTHYMSASAPTAAASYRRYLNAWDEARREGRVPAVGRPVSEPTFRAQIERTELEKREAARGGSRAANAAASPVAPKKKEPSATRPFQRGHVDHYLADLHTVVHSDGDNVLTRRVWITVLRDEYSGMVLGLSIRLKAPSRAACAMVIRDCVRRNCRLPETIVVDNGKEFESTYFEVLLAKYGICKQSRPPGAPRFGSSIESLFKSMREFLRTLPGSTKNDDRGRAVSAKFRGQARALLNIEATYDAVERFCFDLFNQNPLRNCDSSPMQLLEAGLQSASYSGVRVELSSQFLALTAIPTGHFSKIVPQRGVRHLDRWFHSPELFRQKVGARVEVFEDPWERNQIYVAIGDRAVPCFHGRAPGAAHYTNASMSKTLLALEGAEIRAKAGSHRQRELDRLAASLAKSRISSSERDPDCRAGHTLPGTTGVPRPFRTKVKESAR